MGGKCWHQFLGSTKQVTDSCLTHQIAALALECKTTGIRRWLRQENGVFDLDLWVKPVHFGRQGAVPKRGEHL